MAGAILSDACRYYEFRVAELDDRDDRTRIVAETVCAGHHRDFFGFNRAKHAVLEAAILATRTAWLPLRDLLLEFRKLEVLVSKTGGPDELAAFALLTDYLREAAVRQGVQPRPEAHSTMTGSSPDRPDARPAPLRPARLGARLRADSSAAWGS